MIVLRKIFRVYERIEGFFAFFAAILIIAITLMVTIDVVGRNVFNHPLKAAVELSENSLGWITFLAAAWVLKREKHVSVTLVVDRLSLKIQSFMNFITSIIGAIICFGFVVYGVRVILHFFEIGCVQPMASLGLPLGPLYLIIPIGCAFLSIRFIRRAYKYLEEYRVPPREKEDSPTKELPKY